MTKILSEMLEHDSIAQGVAGDDILVHPLCAATTLEAIRRPMASWAVRPSTGGSVGASSCVLEPKIRSHDGGNSQRAQTAVAPLTRRRRNARMAQSSTAATTAAATARLKPPPSPPREPPSCADIDALEDALIVSIRTAGLKPGR